MKDTNTLGLVLAEKMVDTRPEWRTFVNDENTTDPSRVGATADPFLTSSELDTGISQGSGMKELSRIQWRSSHVQQDGILISQYRELTTLCNAINLPKSIIDTAKYIVKSVHDKNMFKKRNSKRGRSFGSIVIAAAIFLACRYEGVPRTFLEISALTQIPKHEIGQVVTTIEKSLRTAISLNADGISHSDSNNVSVSSLGSTANAADLMIRYCSRLHLPIRVQRNCIDLAKRISERDVLTGRSPLSIAAAVILCISEVMKLGLSVREIAEVVGVAEGTVAKARKEIWGHKVELFDPAWST
jgi:transcription initiation factor TFIIB